MKNPNKTSLLVGVLSVLAIVSGVFAVASAQIGAVNNITGWSWSPNIGWISFSSQNPGASTQGSSDYGVYVDGTGNFGGYAWSSNIGWISFNSADLASAPACVGQTRAQVSTSTGRVIGWARALSGIGTNDGWDGCIQLSQGTSGTLFPTGYPDGSKGLTYVQSTGELKGYAWGGLGIGWIQMSLTLSGVVTNPGTLIASCSFASSNVTLPDGSNSINLIPSVTNYSGGTGPYTFTPASFTFTSGYDGYPSVVIRDSLGATRSISCGRLTVTGGGSTGSQQLGLAIDTTASAAEISRDSATPKLFLRRTQGQRFALAWSTNLPDTYTCNTSVSPSVSDWETSIDQAFGTENTNAAIGSQGELSTIGVVVGSYALTVSCTDSEGGAPQSKTATLRVTSSDINEI